MQILKKDIAVFISMLYREKKNEHAPPDLIHRWEQLSQEEINNNLTTLFQKWGLTDAEKQLAITRFYERNKQQPTSSQGSVTPSKPISSTGYNNHPPAYQQPVSAKNGSSTIWWIIGLLLAGVIGYLGYRYIVFTSLTEVYAITDNIAIRNKEGKIVGRMDLYADPKKGSVSHMRTTSDHVFYLKHDGEDKEFPTRRVIMDSVGFFDYLFKADDVTHFVNTNFVVNNKKEFELYQKTFKEINTVPEDNKRLTSIHRKIIAGSMARVSNLKDNYLISNTQGLSAAQVKSTMPYLIQELRPAQHYVIIAGMNDGNYYRFEGDIKLNEFVKPEPVRLLMSNGQPLLQGAYRFQKSSDVYKLYDVVKRAPTNLEARKDAMGKYIAFELHEPIPPPVVDTNRVYTVEEL